MATTDRPAFSWVCPACGRRVPHKLSRCRCGHLPEGPPPAIEAPPASAQSPGSPEPGQWARWTAAAVVLAGALGMLWMHTLRAPERRPPTPATEQPAVAAWTA